MKRPHRHTHTHCAVDKTHTGELKMHSSPHEVTFWGNSKSLRLFFYLVESWFIRASQGARTVRTVRGQNNIFFLWEVNAAQRGNSLWRNEILNMVRVTEKRPRAAFREPPAVRCEVTGKRLKTAGFTASGEGQRSKAEPPVMVTQLGGTSTVTTATHVQHRWVFFLLKRRYAFFRQQANS